MGFKVGDVVLRRSYGRDVCFVIVRIDPAAETATLKGMDVRLLADAPLDDLTPLSESDWETYQTRQAKLERETIRLIQMRRQVDRDKEGYRSERKGQPRDFFERPGRVLHVDGDGTYLDKCLNMYRRLGLRAVGKHIDETEMAAVLPGWLDRHEPDILILTGHDGVLRKGRGEILNIDNYRNSDHFVRAVRAARKFERSLDELIIFAGACQSHYEALLDAGANFASSPERILIHALDPVFVAEKIAYTPIGQTIDIYHVVRSTITGTDGLGGFESRGKFRIGLPRSRY